TSAQLFAPPKRARKTKARLERAKLVVVAARERAAGTAQQYAAQPSTMRPLRSPTNALGAARRSLVEPGPQVFDSTAVSHAADHHAIGENVVVVIIPLAGWARSRRTLERACWHS